MSQKPQQQKQPQPQEHNSLTGRERLYNVVQCLSQSCPWTQTVNAHQMISWLKQELEELHTELDAWNAIIVKETTTFQKNNNHPTRLDLVSELGDVLFNSLMLEMLVRRQYGLEINEAWDAASKKVERRTPYMTEWGDVNGTAVMVVVKDSKEAQRIWKLVKQQEKQERRQRLVAWDMDVDVNVDAGTKGVEVARSSVSSNVPSKDNDDDDDDKDDKDDDKQTSRQGSFWTVGTGLLVGFTLGVLMSNRFFVRTR